MMEKTNEVNVTPVKRKRGRPRKSETTTTAKVTIKDNKKKVTKKTTKTVKTPKVTKVTKKEVKKAVKDYKPDGKLYTCEACNQCQKKCKIQAVKNSILYKCPDFTPAEGSTLTRLSKLDPTFFKGVICIEK